jgi:signal transduction histidine kinase
VTLPGHIVQQIHQHYQATGWAVITLNKKDQVISLNQTACELLGCTEVTDIRETLPLLAAESLQEAFYLPFYHHQGHVFDVHFSVEDDHKFLILVPVDVIHQQVQAKQQMAHDEELEKMRFKGLFEALEDAHQELQEANQAKSFFISALSHEMGNPLNAIKGYNNLLAEGGVGLNEATQIIDNNVDKLTTIIRQTLDYDNQKSNQQRQVFAPAALINDLLRDFQLQASQKSLQLLNQVDPALHVRSHQGKWTQILTNLISNAIKYTDEGSVRVSSLLDAEQLHIDIRDSGCGISEEFREQLFKPWSREYRSAASGNGIGLVISNMLAEQLGARLSLHASDRYGSTFRLSMPVDQLLQSKRILLVDDDTDCLLLFEHYLTGQQHEVTAIDGMPALQKLITSATRFDVIVTDLNLGQQQVTEVLGHLLQLAEKCVVMTANPTHELSAELLQMGFAEVLPKPLSREDLVNSVA